MTPYEVVLVPFPFADLKTVKKRPCLVLSAFPTRAAGKFVVVCMITSNLSGLKFPYDVGITDLQSAGLPKPSIVRLSKVVTLEAKLVARTLGSLGPADRGAVQGEFRNLFSKIIDT